MQNFKDRYVFRIRTASFVGYAKVSKDCINETALSQGDGINRAIRIQLLIDMNAQIVFNGTFVLKNKFLTETADEFIDDCIVSRKDTAVISVERNDTIVSDEQAWIACRLVKTAIQ